MSVDAQHKAKPLGEKWTLRVKKTNETSEDALKVSPILEGLRVTPMAAPLKVLSPCADGKGWAEVLRPVSWRL